MITHRSACGFLLYLVGLLNDGHSPTEMFANSCFAFLLFWIILWCQFIVLQIEFRSSGNWTLTECAVGVERHKYSCRFAQGGTVNAIWSCGKKARMRKWRDDVKRWNSLCMCVRVHVYGWLEGVHCSWDNGRIIYQTGGHHAPQS